MIREELLEKVSGKREEFISWYHEFHQIPELGFEEEKTTKNISADIMIVMIILPAFCSVPLPRCPLFSISPLSESYELP